MFQTSTPVFGEGFHNREAELEALARAIQRLTSGVPQWVAILGPRKIGKTSLVLEAARRAKTPGLRVVTLDIQEQGPASAEIFRRILLRVLDAALGDDPGESFERVARDAAAFRSLLQRSKRFGTLPNPARIELLELAEGEITPDRLAYWLDLPERLGAALDLRFVVALDEFQELGSLASARKGFDPFAVMRSRWQKHRRVAYVISGSARSMLLSLINTEQSPFFQHFSILDLGPFDHSSAVALLQQHSPPEHPISAELATRAVESIGGHPFYLQLLGEALTDQPGAADAADLKSALQGLLFSPTGRLALFHENEFQRRVGRSTFLAATLDALAEGPTTLSSVAERIQAATGATVNYLERLRDAVTRTEDGLYQVTDPTFALWLRWRRPGGTVVPMSVVGDDAELAVARGLSAMGFDLVYQSRASRGAFDLLATRGALQLGIQVKQSPLPLRFSRAEWSRLVADAEKLRWQWVLAAVGKDQSMTILDPAKARLAREVRIDDTAEISNLLRWLDERPQIEDQSAPGSPSLGAGLKRTSRKKRLPEKAGSRNRKSA